MGPCLQRSCRVRFQPGKGPERLRFDAEIAAQPELAFDRGGPIDLEAGEERARRRAAEWGSCAGRRRETCRPSRSLYRDNVPRVFALCCRLAGEPALAEELAQDVFVRAWQRLETFRGESAFSSWLYPLTVNVALSERRSRRRRTPRHGHDDLAPLREGPERAAGPEAGVDLERALATLPPGARAVFVLHDVEGYKHEEIAELTGVATGTSKAQLHRARRLLREALGTAMTGCDEVAKPGWTTTSTGPPAGRASRLELHLAECADCREEERHAPGASWPRRRPCRGSARLPGTSGRRSGSAWPSRRRAAARPVRRLGLAAWPRRPPRRRRCVAAVAGSRRSGSGALRSSRGRLRRGRP